MGLQTRQFLRAVRYCKHTWYEWCFYSQSQGPSAHTFQWSLRHLQRSKSPYSVCYLKQQGKSTPKLRIMQHLISSYFTARSSIHNIIRHRVTVAERLYRPIHEITESESLHEAVLFLNNNVQLIRDPCILTDKHDTELTLNLCSWRYCTARRSRTKYKPPVSTPHYMDGR